MPRGKKNNRMGDPQAVVRMPFRYNYGAAISNSAATTVASANLTAANLGARIAAAAPDFEFFRISKLRAYAFTDVCGPVSPTGAGTFGQLSAMFGIAFDPADTTDTTAPTTVTQVVQYAHADFGNPYQKLRLSMGPRDLYLATPARWYNTTATGSPPALSLSAGTFYMVTLNNVGSLSGVQSMYLIIEGIVEFQGSVTPALALTDSHPGATKIVETPIDGIDDYYEDCKSESSSGLRKTKALTVKQR